jgi:Transposase DDE domain group 1
MVSMRSHHEFTPAFLPFEITKRRLTSMAGLSTLIEAFDQSALKKPFLESLPERKSPRSQGSYRLGLIQMASFMRGHDCLADLEEFRKDPMLFELLKGESVSPRTMGDFLRDFEVEHLEKLNQFLSRQAKAYRLQLERMLKKPFKPSLGPHLSIDSTSHVQSGVKMEGLAYNYKDEWCLDSQVIFDELGFCWDMELRSGNTKSGVGAERQIRRAFAAYKFQDEKYLSGDAAYCNQEVMTTCLSVGAFFTLTANQATTLWEDHIGEIEKWEPWVYTPEELKEAADEGRSLPEIELGRFYWRPSWNEVLRLPVVVKRQKYGQEEQMQLGAGIYKYYGVVTSLPLVSWSLQEVMEHHNQRGNAENFIREEKYGYDLKHFPCLQLKANQAFGLLALAAHNILRWVSIHDNPSRPRFAKGLRRKFIDIPAIVVSHARLLVLRVSEAALKEVNRIREALELKPYNPPISTA